MDASNYLAQVIEFRKLHESGCFIIPNPWDIGSARALTKLGFKALATTSAGFAFTRGLRDEVTSLSCEDVLTNFREIVSATSLPVNADFQSGYASDLEDLMENVTKCVETGVAGLSIEDSTGNVSKPLFERETAIERVKTARNAIDSTGSGVLLTARCEAYLVGVDNPQSTVLDRLSAFADAGADCLFAPGVKDESSIASIIKEVAPKPVNVLMSSPSSELSFTKLADIGVRRVSVGSALARVGWGAWLRAAREIARTGEFDSLAEAASFAELNDIVE